ncbi:unnamed protein product [Arctogadus glacialis]
MRKRSRYCINITEEYVSTMAGPMGSSVSLLVFIKLAVQSPYISNNGMRFRSLRRSHIKIQTSW